MPRKPTVRSIGQRMTAQRRLLFDLIQDSDDHIDADELFQRAKKMDSRISLSTVYRNLRLFSEHGLVKERHFVEDHHYYETKDSTEHCHLICCNCGTVLEVETPLTKDMKDMIENKSQFQVTDIEINMRGYCHECTEHNARDEE